MIIRATNALIVLLFVSGCASMHGLGSGPRPGPGALSYEEQIRLGNVYELRGDLGAALKQYSQARDLDSTDPRVYFGLGNVYLKTHRLVEAQESFLKAIELDPDRGIFYNNLAWAYMELGDIVTAHNTLMMGIGLDPVRRYLYLDTLGMILARGGNHEEAERTFMEAATVIPQDELRGRIQIQTHLRDLYEQRGSDADAKETEIKLLELRELFRTSSPLPPPLPPLPGAQ